MLKKQPFQWMYAEGIIAGGLFFLCGIVCAVTCSPKASGISLNVIGLLLFLKHDPETVSQK